ncbi:MAG: hypothetical protein L0215_22295 [Gemmataceae bacterium]|nr:hypothetical protein [Gemmataceae bacterium]
MSSLCRIVPLLFLPSLVQAESFLPWRNQVEQRLREQHALMLQLLGQRAPAPHQALPIPGQPHQVLPIPGDPKQPLPIPGAPQQELPLPGGPKQELPGPGGPRQDLPPGPQRYSQWRHALGWPIR